MAPKFLTPFSPVILVDPAGHQVGTNTDPVVVTGTVTTADPSVGPTGAPVPADATFIAGENASGDLEAPRVVTTGVGPGLVVSDPALTDGSQLAQVTGTGTAGVPAAGVVSVQGVGGGTPLPVTGTVTAANPSVGTNGAAIPASSTQVGGEDGSGNLQAAQVLAGAPAGTERGLVTRNIPSGTQAVSAAALPLPAGAATEATLAGVLTTAAFQARVNTQGQKVMAASTPVVLASDQSAVPVTGTVTASNPSVGTVGAAAPASATQVAGPDGSGNLAVPQVLTAEPAAATPAMAVRVVPGETPFPVADANLQYLLNVVAQVLGQAQDSAGRLRVNVDPIGGAQSVPVTISSGTVTTVTTVTTVSTVANQTSIGGNIASSVVFDQMQTAWATSLRGQIS